MAHVVSAAPCGRGLIRAGQANPAHKPNSAFNATRSFCLRCGWRRVRKQRTRAVINRSIAPANQQQPLHKTIGALL